jgi:hypothetical protein
VGDQQPSAETQILSELTRLNATLRDIRGDLGKIAKLIEEGRKAQDRSMRVLEEVARGGRRIA